MTPRYILLCLFLILVGIHMLYYGGWTHDDPFITFHYVENVINGKGFVFNEGERLEGYSNFLFLLMLIPAAIFQIGLLGVAKMYGFFAVLGTILLLYSFISEYYPDVKRRHFLILLLLALSGNIALWAVSGMEITVTTFFLTGAWVFFCRGMRKGGREFNWSAIFLLGAALNRHEGVLYFIALGAYLIFAGLKGKIPAPRILLWFALFLLPFGLYNLWRVTYFGALLPNTFYAKVTGSLVMQVKAGVRYAGIFLWRQPYLFLLAPFFPILAVGKWNIERATAILLLLAQLFFIIVCGGDWMPLGRFFVPVLPILFFLWQEGLLETMDWLQGRDTHYRLRDAVGLLCAVLILLSLVEERRATRPIVYSVRTHTLITTHINIGLLLRDTVPPDSLLAGEEAGIIPYYSGLRFLDMVGIVDAHIARQKGSLHFKHDVNYVLERRPDYVLLYTMRPMEEGGEFTTWTETGRQILASERFHREFKPVKSFPHGNRLIGSDYLTLFARR